VVVDLANACLALKVPGHAGEAPALLRMPAFRRDCCDGGGSTCMFPIVFELLDTQTLLN
jgi:hypothetical protein